MQVAVELFGIPQARAGLAQTSAVGSNLGEVLADLARQFPALAETCIDGRALRPGFVANLSAERFVTSPETPLKEGDTVLLLSLDAGG
jgi:molybdopterin converting factor small subunit